MLFKLLQHWFSGPQTSCTGCKSSHVMLLSVHSEKQSNCDSTVSEVHPPTRNSGKINKWGREEFRWRYRKKWTMRTVCLIDCCKLILPKGQFKTIMSHVLGKHTHSNLNWSESGGWETKGKETQTGVKVAQSGNVLKLLYIKLVEAFFFLKLSVF